MSAHQCWFKTDGQVWGPISPVKLRELARNGRITPETPISVDKEQWIPASKVKGLFEPPPAPTLTTPVPTSDSNPAQGRKPAHDQVGPRTAGAPDSRPPLSGPHLRQPVPGGTPGPVGRDASTRELVAPGQSRKSRREGTAATGDPGRNDAPPQHDLPWPIVRVRTLPTHFRLDRGGKEVVMIRPDGISLVKTRGPVTDEMLQSADEVETGTAWTTVPWSAIREIRVKRAGFITASSWWNRFAIETDRKTHKFQVPDREAPHVMQALRELAGDRFREEPSRRLSAGEFAMIGLGILALLVLASGLASSTRELKGLGLVLLILAGLFPLANFWERWRSDYQTPQPPRKKRHRASGRAPFPVPDPRLEPEGDRGVLYLVHFLRRYPFAGGRPEEPEYFGGMAPLHARDRGARGRRPPLHPDLRATPTPRYPSPRALPPRVR